MRNACYIWNRLNHAIMPRSQIDYGIINNLFMKISEQVCGSLIERCET